MPYIESPTGSATRDPGYASAQIVEIGKRYFDIGSPWSLIENRFTMSSTYAASSYEKTYQYIDEMRGIVKDLEERQIPEISVVSPEIPAVDYNSRPTLGAVDLTALWPANTSTKPELDTVPGITFNEMPILTARPPLLNLPLTPDVGVAEGPGDAPIIREVKVPLAPSVVLPDAPTFADIILPPAPDIFIPAFDTVLQDESLPDPAALAWRESPFNSDIWNVLLDKARTGIVEGGTGLDPEVEQAIWDRALSRQDVESEKTYQELERYFTARGFDMPPGALAGRLQEASAEADRNKTDLNRDIMYKQADLAQTNTHFMLEFGRQAELILRDFHNAQEDRGLEAAKAIASNSIDVLNAHVSKYNIKIEKYKADAIVFGERVKAALVEVEIFKERVESAKVSVEVQKALADLYGKQVAAVETTVKIFAVEMDGAKTAAEIEALKIQIFGEKVKAYVADMEAERLKLDAYKSGIEGEKAKVEVYSEEVRAFVSRIEAEKVQVDMQDTAVRAVAVKNGGDIERYKAELQAYSVEIDAEAKRIGGIVQGFSAEVSGYSAETNAESSRLQAVIAEINARIEEGRFNIQKALAEIDSSTKGYVALKELQIKGTDGVMGVSGQLAASAMNAASASASYGYSGSESTSNSFQQSASTSEQHSFSHPTRQLS